MGFFYVGFSGILPSKCKHFLPSPSNSFAFRHTACKSDVTTSNNIVVSSGVRGNTTCDPSDSCNCDPSDTCITGINSNSKLCFTSGAPTGHDASSKVMPVLFYASLAYSHYHKNEFQVCWDVPTGHDASSSNTRSTVSTISHQCITISRKCRGDDTTSV